MILKTIFYWIKKKEEEDFIGRNKYSDDFDQILKGENKWSYYNRYKLI